MRDYVATGFSTWPRSLPLSISLAVGVLLGCGGSEKCGAGSIEKDGQCVTACGEHLAWVPEAGGCVPVYDDSYCGFGRRWSDSEMKCVLREADIYKSAAQDDPLYGGMPARFELPATGSSLWIGGNVDPPADVDSDGFPEPDLDFFLFEGRPSQIFRFDIVSGGTPSAEIQVWPTDQYDYINQVPDSPWDFVRPGARQVVSQSAKRVCLHAATPGRVVTCYFTIMESRHYYLIVSDQANFDGVPIGGQNMDYLVGITPVAGAYEPLALGETAQVHFVMTEMLSAFEIAQLAAGKVYEVAIAAAEQNESRMMYLFDSTGYADLLFDISSRDIGFLPLRGERFTGGWPIHIVFESNMNSEYLHKDYSVTLTEKPVTDLGALTYDSPSSSPVNDALAEPASTNVYRLTLTGPAFLNAQVTDTTMVPQMRILDEAYHDWPAWGHQEPYYPGHLQNYASAFIAATTPTVYYVEVFISARPEPVTAWSGPVAYTFSADLGLAETIVEEAEPNNSLETKQVLQPFKETGLSSDQAILYLVHGSFSDESDVDFYNLEPPADEENTHVSILVISPQIWLKRDNYYSGMHHWTSLASKFFNRSYTYVPGPICNDLYSLQKNPDGTSSLQNLILGTNGGTGDYWIAIFNYPEST